jgi:FkbM family methyltransferase
MNKRLVTRNGHTYQVDDVQTSEGYDFWTVFENRSWEPELDEVLNQFLKPTGSLLDIGAWIGPITLMAAPLCRHVYAVEPDPVAAQYLRTNLALSHVTNVTVHEWAIGSSDNGLVVGPTKLGNLGDSMTTIWTTSADAITVRSTTMETLIKAGSITDVCLVKIDVEGAEQEFLSQAAPVLHSLGAPILLSLHTMLAPDPTQYLRTINYALSEFDTTIIAGTVDALGVLLAVPR